MPDTPFTRQRPIGEKLDNSQRALRKAESISAVSPWDRIREWFGMPGAVTTPEGGVDWKATARKPPTDQMLGMAMGSITLPAGTQMFHGTPHNIRGTMTAPASSSSWLGDQVHFAADPNLATTYATTYAQDKGRQWGGNLVKAILKKDTELLDATAPLPARDMGVLRDTARKRLAAKHPDMQRIESELGWWERLQDPTDITDVAVELHHNYPWLFSESPFAGVQYQHPEVLAPGGLGRFVDDPTAWSFYPGKANIADISGNPLVQAIIGKQ